MELLILVGVVILTIFINHLIAAAFYDIAQKKGHSEKRYYWLPFWLGVVGYCLVAALPDLFARPQKQVEAPYITPSQSVQKEEKEEKKEQSNLLDIFKTDN